MADTLEGSAPEQGSGADLVRLRLDIAYDGTAFSGWALQPGRRTVQAEVQSALQTVLRQPELRLTVAGRTDAGVHASGQVAHVDVAAQAWREAGPTQRQLAAVLPADVRVRSIREVPASFDARFSALWRRYEYRISDDPTGVDPLRRHDVLAWRRSLDASAMHVAGQALLGLHDFAAFCRVPQDGSTIRTLQLLQVRRGPDAVVCVAQADAFCHSMVRSLVGALLAVGDGRQDAAWLAALLRRGRGPAM